MEFYTLALFISTIISKSVDPIDLSVHETLKKDLSKSKQLQEDSQSSSSDEGILIKISENKKKDKLGKQIKKSQRKHNASLKNELKSKKSKNVKLNFSEEDWNKLRQNSNNLDMLKNSIEKVNGTVKELLKANTSISDISKNPKSSDLLNIKVIEVSDGETAN